MAIVNKAPIPLEDPIAQVRRESVPKGQKDPLEGHITLPWIDFFTAQGDAIQAAPSRVNAEALTNQDASVGATDLTGGNASAGLYRLTYYARLTQAATTSSSLEIVLDWTDNGIARSFNGAAITSNSTTTGWQSETKMIRSDGLSPIRYSTIYSSTGGTPMLYALSVVLEALK